jgi:nitrate/TMAO reductase-like tetraheme cytochrome c subunit
MKRVIGLLLCACCVWLPVRAADQAAPPTDYTRAKWDPIHFKPAIEQAKDADCLVCHQEVLKPSVSAKSPAGVTASEAMAWYQTLDTYKGEQDTFHRRHLVTDYAKQVMDLKCNTCHQGNDPREETANSSATGDPTLTQRKHVDPNICLMCHGKHNGVIMGVPAGDWREVGSIFNFNCLTCHAAIRTNRHQVNFLKPKAIEEAAAADPDVCFGCHGGRAWYRIEFPYPRNAWPGGGDVVPDWAKARPAKSEPRFLIGVSEAKP